MNDGSEERKMILKAWKEDSVKTKYSYWREISSVLSECE
jgi:hypothetical protein